MMASLKTMAMSPKHLKMGSGVWAEMGARLLLSSFGLLLLLPTIAAQPGFISIDCGSNANYTDSSTGLYWTTDEGYISVGSNELVTVSSPQANNNQQLTTARYFNPGRKKNCYALPVLYNNSYLIRAFFLYGDLNSSLPSDYGFNLSIDSTIVGSVSVTPSDVNSVVSFEFFAASTSTQINFCIIPVVGDAFISSLELRPLLPTMYKGVMFQSKYTKCLYRLNCGAGLTDPTVRYPDDVYDRLWMTPGSSYTISIISATRNLGTVPAVVFDQPPLKVMETAWSDESFWFNWPFYEESTTEFYISLYFVEVGTPTATDIRSVDVLLNGNNWYKAYNVSQTIDELYDAQDTINDGHTNFTLSEDPISTLPALLNGAEIHAIYDTDTSTTEPPDVSAIEDLCQSLNLLDWTGDPCLPVAWDWLNCSSSVPPRVTQVKLSDYQLTGTIPASIASLTELTDLWLDSNFITGSIPDLAGLYNLRTLHLENNSLTGYIPATLADIPFLSELFLEDNKLTGPVPAALLNKKGLLLWVDSPKSSSSGGVSGAVVGAAIGAAVIVVIIIALAIFFCCRRRNKKRKTQPQPEITGIQTGASKWSDSSNRPSPGGPGSHHVQTTRAFSQAEVLVATESFRMKIGEGGFGPVYYGKLETGEEVAVKVNSATSGQGSVEFSTEVSLLSRVHHRNLVSLVGFCDEGEEQILIYEYMQNGTLREHLYGSGLTKVIDWRTRLDIAVNAARGLEYLHYDCSPKIIHRDVKSNNILLSEKLLAKVADFGISKLAPEEDTTTGVSTIVRGTTGYLDPEYFSTNKLTQKSDVYAFGVVLLEIICGRPPNNNKLADSLQWNLVEYGASSSVIGGNQGVKFYVTPDNQNAFGQFWHDMIRKFCSHAQAVYGTPVRWVRGMLRDGNLEGIVDPALRGSYNVEAMWKLAELALYSVEPVGMRRPDMRQVVRELMEAIDLEHVRSPTTSTSGVHGGFTSTIEDDTQTSYPSLPSTRSSQPEVSPHTHAQHFSPNVHQGPQIIVSENWNKPRAR